MGEGSQDASGQPTTREHHLHAHSEAFQPTDAHMEDLDEAGSGDDDEEDAHSDPGLSTGVEVGMDDMDDALREDPTRPLESHHTSAFVRPTPLHLRPEMEALDTLGSLGGALGGGLGGGSAGGALGNSPLAHGAHLPPLWYPPWVAAFKPMFGLQGKRR